MRDAPTCVRARARVLTASVRVLLDAGLDSELQKAFQEGKSIIIEGIHLDLRLYESLFNTERAVVVPVLLTLPDADNRSLVSDWLESGCHPNKKLLGATHADQVQALFAHYQAVQNELFKCSVQSTTVSVRHPDETLQALHSEVLERMMAAVAALHDES